MQEQGKSLQGQGLRCKSPEAEKNWVDSGAWKVACVARVWRMLEKRTVGRGWIIWSLIGHSDRFILRTRGTPGTFF